MITNARHLRQLYLRVIHITAIVLVTYTASATDHITLSGQLSAHDPSSVITESGKYYYFSTGSGILSRSSTNMISWSSGPSVFSTPPAWTTTAVPGFGGNFWAPDIVYFNGLYHLYYSVSTWGSQVSAIGMATSPTLNPSSPNYTWTDQGPVIQSTIGNPYNTIDPSILQNSDGTMWMTFGSYWNGIYQVQLDPLTGMRLYPAASPTHLAFNTAQYDPIEASAMHRRGNYYYLFVNWGTCCQGVNSTYNIRMGRSTSVNGPFYDQNGVSMISGGGTLFLGAEGNYIGPGHFEAFTQSGLEYFSYHYYDGNNNGAATFGINKLYWSADAWPTTTLPNPVWCGGSSANNYWNSPYNWGGKVPVIGTDELVFGEMVAGGYSVAANNLPDSSQFNAIRFRTDSSAYTLEGNSIRLAGPMENLSGFDQIINLDMQLDAGSGVINTGAKKLTLAGQIGEYGGPRGITKNGGGELLLKGQNIFSGNTNIDQGTLTLEGGDLSDSLMVNVAAGALFKITSGTPGVGDVLGSGSTVITGEGTTLTVNSLAQSRLALGPGTKLILRPSASAALTDVSSQPVPEPNTMMILSAFFAVLLLSRRKRVKLSE